MAETAPLVRNPVRELRQTLQSAYFEQSLSPEQLQAKLTALRDARAKSREELAAARKALTEVVTVRQEVLLVASGILE
jgi:anthranilate phosphoribosyltransferase